MTACKKQQATEPFTGSPAELNATIGVSKIIAHPALDAIEQGLQDELRDLGYTGLNFDLQSANGEISTASSIANKFRSSNVAVAVGIATPMALSLANATKTIPVVFSAVTDPIDAGLRSSNDKDSSNITGVSDMTPVEQQVKLIRALTHAESVGHIYNPGEANSVVLLNMLTVICEKNGIAVVATTVSNTSEVKQAAEILGARGVDAIYVSTDNVVAAAIGSVTTTAAKYDIPVIGADPVTSAGTGALAAYGVDYYKAGRQTGKIIARILTGEKPGDIPVKYMTEPAELTLYLDKEVADRLGISVPDNLEELVK